MPEYSAQALAGLVDGKLEGDGDRIVTGVADLRSAAAGDVSFLGNLKYLSAARATRAGVVLLAPDVTGDFSFTRIRVASPSLAFSRVIEIFRPVTPRPEPGVHPSAVLGKNVRLAERVTIQPHAVIEDETEIGPGTVVGAGSFIGRECRIGGDCFLYPRVVLRERTVVGCRVIVHSGAVIGADGFGYELQQGRHAKIPQLGFVQLDDDVEIGANTTVDRGRFGRTWIQQGAKIDNLVQIAHNVVIGMHSIVVAQAGISGSTTLGDYVTLAGQAGVVGHVHIGDRATVTAQSGVSKDVPQGMVVAGRHAVPLRESLRLEALLRRLPELWDRIRALEKRKRPRK